MVDTQRQIMRLTNDLLVYSKVAGTVRRITMPVRVRRVDGLEGRMNDVLFQPAALRPASLAPRDQHTLVFFGGDVQDYPEVMEVHRDSSSFQQWNLERTARLLGQSFPDKHVVVIRPSRIEFQRFSCYDNFVPSNNAGVPEHTATHAALTHLERLLQGVSARLKIIRVKDLLKDVTSVALPEEIDIEDLHSVSVHPPATVAGSSHDAPLSAAPLDNDCLWWRSDLSLDQTQLSLVGFSKGCVVLNQFIYEFHYTKTLTPGDLHSMSFISRISSMYWLDGGHAGGKNTWLTARSLLETLARLGVNIYVHVSPYQVKDQARPWIGREEKTFTAMLKNLGAKISRYMHDSGTPYSLNTHFDVLANFKRVQDSTTLTTTASHNDIRGE